MTQASSQLHNESIACFFSIGIRCFLKKEKTEYIYFNKHGLFLLMSKSIYCDNLTKLEGKHYQSKGIIIIIIINESFWRLE